MICPGNFHSPRRCSKWIIRRTGVSFVIHYLDEFLVIGAPATSECSVALGIVMDVFHRLGFPVAVEKLEGPTPHLEFLGFEFNSQAMEVRLARTKLSELRTLIRQCVSRRSCVERTGISCWKTRPCNNGGKAREVFMHRMFELLGRARHSHHHLRLNLSFRSDLL